MRQSGLGDALRVVHRVPKIVHTTAARAGAGRGHGVPVALYRACESAWSRRRRRGVRVASTVDARRSEELVKLKNPDVPNHGWYTFAAERTNGATRLGGRFRCHDWLFAERVIGLEPTTFCLGI